MNNLIKFLLPVVLLVLITATLLWINAISFPKKQGKEQALNSTNYTISETEEICLSQLDSLTSLNKDLQYKYDSLLLVCNPITEEPVFVKPKKRTVSNRVIKVDTLLVKEMDTAKVNQLTNQLVECQQIQDSYKAALVNMDSSLSQLRRENELLREPRYGEYKNDHIYIASLASPDTTLYNLSFTPELSASVVRIKRPLLSITPRKFVLTTKENNPYANNADNKAVFTKEYLRKEIPKDKGNHRVKVK